MVKMIDEVFERKNFIPDRLVDFGFQKTEKGFSYQANFLDNAFRAVIKIQDGKIDGHVIDLATGDEYFQIDVPAMQGAFVSSVRAGYLEILTDIADRCCQTMPFASPQANRIAELIKQKYRAEPDFPWESEQNRGHGVFRHHYTSKWFGLIMNIKRGLLTDGDDEQRVDVINLKSNTLPVDCRTVFPAYHMNHKYWISVVLDDRLSEAAVMKMIDESFVLTTKNGKKKWKNATDRTAN